MDNLAKANRYFERKAYFPCGIDIDALPEGAVRIALKRLWVWHIHAEQCSISRLVKKKSRNGNRRPIMANELRIV